jgi:AcrR family transcriptional regulator
MADAGLTRGGFYTYFKSKDDLYVEALACFFTDPDWKDRWEGVEIDLSAADIGAQIVQAYLSRQHFEAAGNSCPMVALPSDVARSTPPVKRAFETVFKAMVDILERSLGIDRRDIREDSDSRDRTDCSDQSAGWESSDGGYCTDLDDLDNRAADDSDRRHRTAQAIAALCVGGMVVARSMADRELADQLLDASRVIALELGGWDAKLPARTG